jgi:Ca2+-binding EF-hand superfamily protein
MNPKLVAIMKSWFDEYSTDGKMFPSDCSKFINSCTGDVCDADDKRIKDLFSQWDSDCKGYLSLSNFLSLYKDACEKKPRVVWSNLQNKNYRNDLSLCTEEQLETIA